MDYTRLALSALFASAFMWLASTAIISVIKVIPVIIEHPNMVMATFTIAIILTAYFYKTLNLE